MMMGVLVMTALVYNFQRRGERYYFTAFVFIVYEVILFFMFVGNFIRGLFLNNPDYTFHRLHAQNHTEEELDEEEWETNSTYALRVFVIILSIIGGCFMIVIFFTFLTLFLILILASIMAARENIQENQRNIMRQASIMHNLRHVPF